jgi:hypothetical protein
MYSTEDDISKIKPKTIGEIVGICFGILIGSIFVMMMVVGVVWNMVDKKNKHMSVEPSISGLDAVLTSKTVGWIFILFLIGTPVGIAFLPYRTSENIINESKGISYISTAQIFAIVLGIFIVAAYFLQ